MDIGIVHRFLGDWDFLAAAQEMAKLPRLAADAMRDYLQSVLLGPGSRGF